MLHTRFYSKKTPEDGDICQVEILDKSQDGIAYYAKILDYGDLEGMIPITELVRGRVRSKKYASKGDKFPALITDGNTSCIMMSKIKVHRYDRENYSDRYDSLVRINKIGNTLCVYRLKCLKDSGVDITDSELQNDVAEKVMSETVWRLLDDLEDLSKESCETLYSDILLDPSILVQGSKLFSEDSGVMEFLNGRIKRGDVTLSNEFELITYQDIDEIKRILNTAKNVEEEGYTFSIKCISPPVYGIFATGLDEDKVKKILSKMMDNMNSEINKRNTLLTMKEEYKQIGKPEVAFSALSLYAITKAGEAVEVTDDES